METNITRATIDMAIFPSIFEHRKQGCPDLVGLRQYTCCVLQAINLVRHIRRQCLLSFIKICSEIAFSVENERPFFRT